MIVKLHSQRLQTVEEIRSFLFEPPLLILNPNPVSRPTDSSATIYGSCVIVHSARPTAEW